MYMLRYKFREAADLQGGGGRRMPPTPPRCGPDLSQKIVEYLDRMLEEDDELSAAEFH